jgi:hypothetical protein
VAGQYWVQGPNGKQGPFDQLQVRGLVADGQLTPSMEISTDGMSWHPAGKVKGLFPAPEPKPILDFASDTTSAISPEPLPPPLPARPAETSAPLPLPTSRPLPSPRAPARPLWNPAAAVNWSILFTPIFGAYLHTKNWEALGEPARARSSIIWFWVNLVLIGIAVLGPLNEKATGGVMLWMLILWYIFAARKQISYVRERFGKNYPRRSFGKPILIATLIMVAALIVTAVIALTLYPGLLADDVSSERAAVALQAAPTTPVSSQSRQTELESTDFAGKCLLVVNGQTYINGECDVSLKPDGSFFMGAGHEVSPRYFVYINTVSLNQASGNWNGREMESHAGESLGNLVRNGDCWQNETVNLCASKN